MLEIYGVILDVVRRLGPVMSAIERKDGDLARQMRRAATSVALNVAEGAHSQGKNRVARYHNAFGSMREALACIEVSEALGYTGHADPALLDSIDRILRTLSKMTS